MRTVIAVIGLLAGLAVPAHASDRDPEIVDGLWAWQKRSIGVSIGGGASQLDGLSVGGFGPTVDVGLGDGRFQYFAEASLWFVSAGPSSDSRSPSKKVSGLEGRGGVGVRWLARSFVMERDVAIELVLEAFAGLEQFWWNQGGRLTRPDLGAGFTWQIRMRNSQFVFRTSARVYFAPSDPDNAVEICRGACMVTPTASSWSSGLMVNTGVAW